ncbi:ABC transporter ATP-binding protein [Salmonella enterica subsp. enterica serovar Hartford]|nr:ABC transporter ATP-binding protein [Salmonella enterica subsp. enterica serovar Hartford]
MRGLMLRSFSAGYSTQPVIANLNVPLLPRGKITILLGRTAVVNRRYYVRWPG